MKTTLATLVLSLFFAACSGEIDAAGNTGEAKVGGCCSGCADDAKPAAGDEACCADEKAKPAADGACCADEKGAAPKAADAKCCSEGEAVCVPPAEPKKADGKQ